MKGISLEPYRVSVSSVPSSSSQGSGRDGCDTLGDVFLWGEGIGNGVLGGGVRGAGTVTSAKMDALFPKALNSALTLDVQFVACGGRHAALVTRHGDVFSWGEEFGGRLGHGLHSDVPYPQRVEALANNTVDFVACGEYHTCAVTLSGDLYTWGGGANSSGLLGHGNDLSHWMPRKVSGPLEGVRVSLVSCGPWHTALITSAGQLFTFGDGTFGVLGHGDRKSVSTPREVESLIGWKTITVSCGLWHTTAVVEVMGAYSGMNNCSSGKLFTWGDGDSGRLGHGDNLQKLVPTYISSLKNHNFRQVACGHSLTVALTTTGQVFTMGSPVYGQLGNPNASGIRPVRVEGKLLGAFVEEIACGTHHVAVLTTETEVYTWGKGANGRLGHGDIEDRKCPTLVDALKDKKVKRIVCGSTFTAAICHHKWALGTEQSVCAGCRSSFSFTRKRHNCYNCGAAFCHACSSRKAYKASMAPNLNKAYRVCDSCYTKLKVVREPVVATHNHITKGRQHIGINYKPQMLDGKFSVLQLALPIIPGLQLDGRGLLKPRKRSLLSTKHLAPTPGGLLSSSQAAAFMTCDPMLQHYNANQSLLATLQSGKGLRSASPFLKGLSPPHSMTPTPAVGELTSPWTGTAKLKMINDRLSQEILKLQEEVEKLTIQQHNLQSKWQQSEKRAQKAIAMAAEEAAKCKTAKEVIKSLTRQLKDLAERLPLGPYQNERLQTYAGHNWPANGFCSFSLDDQSLPRNDIHLAANSDTIPKAQREAAHTAILKHVSKNVQDLNSNGTARTLAFDKRAHETDHKLVREQTAVGPIEKISNVPCGLAVGKYLMNADNAMCHREHESGSEWVEQDDLGVYISLTALPGGGTDLKRVRFSRRMFNERQAELWWAEHQANVFEKYNVRSLDKVVPGTSMR